MSKPTRVSAGLVTASAWCVFAIAGCGGKEKPAETAGTCPEGTVLSGDSCLPASASTGKKSGDDDDSPKGNAKSSTPSPSHASASPTGNDTESSGGGGSYDKEAVEAQLKRAAKQIKNNCGAASDDEGNRNGPWGSTSATIVLGRNGHVREVTVPPPYTGTPAGECVVNSFRKLIYPPYAGSSDATVNWDVEVVKPKP